MCPAPDTEAQAAEQVIAGLRRAGHTAYLAGGCVRDLQLGRTPKDYDVATNAEPAAVAALFPGSDLVGKAFGVVLVAVAGYTIEVATFRIDHSYSDKRHPDRVTFADAQADAQRRDFTVNALFLDPETGRVHDFVDGIRDLRDGVIRCVGSPHDRFGEDSLRMLRAVRFASVLEFSLAPDTQQAIAAQAHDINAVSHERTANELNRLMLEAPAPSTGFRLLDKTGLLPLILPEVADMQGVSQDPAYHPEGDVFTHTMLMLDAMRDRSLPLAYAVLLHDIGKPCTGSQKDGRIHFYGHEETGASMAEALLHRLRLPTRMMQTVCHCIRNHMRLSAAANMRTAKLRRLIGAATFPLELELHRLDRASGRRDLSTYDFLRDAAEHYREQEALPPPLISGHDLLALGVPPGPQVGEILNALYDYQLEHDKAATRDILLARARDYVDGTSPPSQDTPGRRAAKKPS